MPTQPINAHLNLDSQTVMNIVSYVLTIALLAWTLRMWRKERSPFYTLLVLASMVAAFGEPLYDEAFSLYFYTKGDGHGITTLYTAFNVPQPIWAYSGYALLYGLPAVFMTQKIRQGKLTSRGVFAWAGVEFLMSCAFEIIGINIGTYTYWGPHALRIDHYPLVIPILEAAQVMSFAIAASWLRKRSRTQFSYLGLFVLFPITMFGANFGAGSPVILAIHADGTTYSAVLICTLVSIVFALTLIRFVSCMIPSADVPADGDKPSVPESITLPEQSLASV